MLGILTENFRIYIVVVALRVFGKVIVTFDQVQRGAAYFSGNRIAVKLIVKRVNCIVAAVIAIFVIRFFIYVP